MLPDFTTNSVESPGLIDARLGKTLVFLVALSCCTSVFFSLPAETRAEGAWMEFLAKQLADPLIGQQLIVVQIDQQTLDPGTVLSRLVNPGGKHRPRTMDTPGTILDLALMLGHL